MTSEARPLLSICIPTFNRAALLDVCLASLLPQTEHWPELVEVIVSDNASTDNTPAVLDKYAERFHFRRHRNAENIGLLGNITFVPSGLAQGEFAWLLGDDDLLAAGAVDQVLAMLHSEPDIDLLALNVGYYAFADRPTAQQAQGGIGEAPATQLRSRRLHGRQPFAALLEGPCADFTAMYACVLRRRWWTEEFPEPISGAAFISVRTSYPVAYLIAKYLTDKPAAALRAPLVCIYAMPAEQFSWAAFHPLTVVLRATELLKLFESQGVPRSVLEPYYMYQLNNRGSDLGNLIWDRRSKGGWRAAARFAWLLRRYPLRLLKVFIVACGHPHSPALLRLPVQWRLKSK